MNQKEALALARKKKLTSEEFHKLVKYRLEMSLKENWDFQVAEGVVNEIDRPIRGMIVALNNKGFYTGESCSGHKRRPGDWYKRGHIWMYARTTRDPEVRAIMQKHGARNITREKDYVNGIAVWIYSFDALG